jgi:hypothetical protein
VPPEQVQPGEQALPQVPQLASVLSGSPLPHWHALLTHVMPPVQGKLHVPQLALSLTVLTQVPEQSV